jgi:hypothetical protein
MAYNPITTSLNLGLTNAIGIIQKLSNYQKGQNNGLTTHDGTVIITSKRNIATILPDVTIEEVMTDELEISQHPIEQGTPITDNAFRKPQTLVIRAGWTDASNPANTIDTPPQILSNGGSSPYLKGIYQNLLALQNSFQPFSITTGKRIYNNMLMRSLKVETDKNTENVLMITAEFQEVLLATTSQVATSALQSSQTQNQTYTAVTSAPYNGGTIQGVAAPSSVNNTIPTLGGKY